MALPTIVGVGTPAGGTGSVAPGLPSGWAADDCHVLITNTKRAETQVSVSGFTFFAAAIPTGDNKVSVFLRNAQSGDAAPTVPDSGDHTYAVIIGFRNPNGGTCTVDAAFASAVVNAASGSVSWPDLTTPGADRMILHALADGRDATGARFSGQTNANLANLAEQFDNGITSNGGGGLVIVTGEKATAGAIGNTTGTLTSATQALLTISIEAPSSARTVSAGAGSYAVAGTAAALKVARRAVADVGSYAVSGSPAGVLVGRLVSATAAAYALSGASAGALMGRGVAAAAGGYAVTGQAAAALRTRLLAAASAGYAIGGAAASLLHANRVSAVAGAYSIEGQPATLTLIGQLSVEADAGAYGITGAGVSLVQAHRVAAAAGAYNIGGVDAALIYHPAGAYLVGADAGGYALSGQPAGVLFTRLVAANDGSYALSGSDAEFVAGSRIEAGSGDYSLAGGQAGILVSRLVSAASAAYGLLGASAGIIYASGNIRFPTSPSQFVGQGDIARHNAASGSRPESMATAERSNSAAAVRPASVPTASRLNHQVARVRRT